MPSAMPISATTAISESARSRLPESSPPLPVAAMVATTARTFPPPARTWTGPFPSGLAATAMFTTSTMRRTAFAEFTDHERIVRNFGHRNERFLMQEGNCCEATETKNPPAVCLGRARVDNRWATVSPYSPCCFQEYLHHLNTDRPKKLLKIS